jgi:uncharacterized cupin superfamily protein
VESEWALMLDGNARITAVDQLGQSFVNDVSQGDLWLFPAGIPHSIRVSAPTHLNVGMTMLQNIPKQETVIRPI